MAVVATISSWEKRRPLILAILVLAAAAWLASDGWINWPKQDNAIVRKMLQSHDISARGKRLLHTWPGWQKAAAAQRLQFDRFVHRSNFAGWHSVTDIKNQRWIFLVTVVLGLGSLIWFFRVRGRQITAAEGGLILADRTEIHWNNITAIDNRKWASHGIVTITYKSAEHQMKQTKMDGVIYENLGPLLNEMAARATEAKMIPPT